MALDIITTAAAVLGVVLAGLALRVSVRARGDSSDSADAAKKSAAEAARGNEIAAEANERAARAEQRATTRNDVVWDVHVDDQSRWHLVNTGLDDAHGVEVFLNFDDENLFVELGTITGRGGAAIAYDLSELRAARAQRAVDLMNEMSAQGIGYVTSGALKFAQRITWDDAAGNHHTTGTDHHSV